MTLGDAVRVPFDAVRYAFRELRKALFTADRPTGVHLVVDATVAECEAALGRQSYAPNWEFSYYERGEVLNLARVVHDERRVEGRVRRWWQTHVRGWDHPDGLALHGHWELEPTENPDAHLDGVGFDAETGTANLRRALDEAGVAYAETEIT
ncbi:MAG: hypothetical protein ABEH47_03340 [Haloferacaceae archaeon]